MVVLLGHARLQEALRVEGLLEEVPRVVRAQRSDRLFTNRPADEDFDEVQMSSSNMRINSLVVFGIADQT